ncbi:MAG TPA: hypothetical protein PKE64_04090 [Anaerolineae bacterium]|nr:hypothetical protein [Anaerolineae bacterium]
MRQARKRNAPTGLMIVVGTLAFLALLLVIAVGLLVVSQFFTPAGQLSAVFGVNPLNELNIEEIDPALAVASLGGAADDEVIRQALNQSRPETALATLLFASTITNRQTAGGLLQLAEAYVEAGNTEKATFVYELAGTVATLAPELPDTTRTDIFIQAARELSRLNRQELAKFYLDQAYVIAANSPTLQAAPRRALFESLHSGYQAAGESTLARQSLTLSADPPAAQGEAPPPLLPARRAISLPTPAQEAEARRWQTAQELVVRLVRNGTAPQTSVDALGQALVIEDLEKTGFFERQIAETTQIRQRIDIVQAQIDWLSIKYRVARRAYGLSLVPEWEAQAERIRSNLTKSYETLFALYSDWAVALPNASQIDQVTVERLRQEVLAGQLGRYPNYPEQQRQRQLEEAAQKLLETQPELRIFVATATINNETRFKLIAL